MVTTLILLFALAGLALLVYLVLAGGEESDTWTARSRRRLRLQHVRSQHVHESPETLGREQEERQRIEEKLEEERSRSALQDAD